MENPDVIINNLISEYGEALNYNSFDTIEIRRLFRDSGGTMNDLIKLLIAYTSIGNNHENLISKVKDSRKGREILVIIKKFQISERVRGKDSNKLTLPRIASSFAPFLIKLRIGLKSKNLLQHQINTTTPIELQDIALNMLESNSDFNEKFSVLIANNDRRGLRKDKSEDEILKEVRFYNNLAKNGLERDIKLKEALIDYENNTEEKLLDLFNN